MGAGTERVTTCRPSCADGKYVSHPVRIRLIHPADVTGSGKLFTTALLEYPRGDSKGARRRTLDLADMYGYWVLPGRAPSRTEAAAIRRVADARCRPNGGGPAEGLQIRVSRINGSYASAHGVCQERELALVVKRLKNGTWKIAVDGSGGPDSCSAIGKVVPIKVAKELEACA